MRRVNGFFLYALGTGIRPLATAIGFFKDRNLDQQMMSVFLGAIYQLNPFVEAAENQRSLPTSVDCANRLITVIKGIFENKQPIGEHDIYAVLGAINRLEVNLETELTRLHVYELVSKRAYDTDVLIRQAEQVLSPAHRQKLSAFSVQNIRDAGRCLMIDQFTAAGFHMMRSVEEVTRQYYKSITGRDHDSGTRRTFGMLASELKDAADLRKKQNQEHEQLDLIASILRQLCVIYRNTVAHPEIDTLDEDTAIMVFAKGADVIASMLNEIA